MKPFKISLLLFLTSCCARDREYAELASSHIVYFKDQKVNLCYAQYDRSITNVPCKSVEKYLINP